MNDGDDRDRPQTADDDPSDRHSQVVTSRGTGHLLHESATCHKINRISISQQCRYVEEDTSLGRREQSAGCAGSRVASWKRVQTLTGSHHERRTLPQGMDQETASGVLVHRQERAVRRSQICIRMTGYPEQRTWDPERCKGLGDIMWAESTFGRFSNDVLGQLQRVGHTMCLVNTSTCRVYGYREHPSQKDSS